MKTYSETTEAKRNEIDTLCKYASLVSKEYDKEITDKDELWEEQYKLKQVVKKKILQILNY